MLQDTLKDGLSVVPGHVAEPDPFTPFNCYEKGLLVSGRPCIGFKLTLQNL